MTYAANPIPTLSQLASGELEPTTQTFKGAVGAYRSAPLMGVMYAFTMQWAAMSGFASHAPETLLGMAAQAAAMAFFQIWWSSLYIRRHRPPSAEQITHLTGLVSADPSLAHKVALLGEKDYTFFKTQQFILKNSKRANEVRMACALDDLDAAVNGKN